MPVVRHNGSSPWPVYNGGSWCKGFVRGEQRECSQELADYLVATFPTFFEVVEPKRAKAAAPKAPAKDRAMAAPAKRKAPAKKRKSTLKKGKA